MTKYKVLRFDSHGVPINNGEFVEVEAPNKLEAAQICCGTRLTREHRADMYRRADVRQLTHTHKHHYFYAAG